VCVHRKGLLKAKARVFVAPVGPGRQRGVGIAMLQMRQDRLRIRQRRSVKLKGCTKMALTPL